ncbi:MAG: UDP-2,3-diacylglucosamine diphosphatase LpxI [Paracoccaceae bacterium]
MLALIAGEGALPVVVADALKSQGRGVFVCELEGHPSSVSHDTAPISFRIEQLGSLIEKLIGLGVKEICFAGRVARPALDPSAIDPQTLPLVPRMMAALQAGDDAALRVVISFFEDAGMTVLSAHQLVPDLLPDEGVLTTSQPADQHRKDAARGADIIAAMGAVDVGQACVVARGQALAIEALPGTDAMLRTLLVPGKPAATPRSDPSEGVFSDPIGWAADWLTGEPEPTAQAGELAGTEAGAQAPVRNPALPEGGLLVKMSKPGQDRRVDLPTIGPATIRLAALCGLDGVVIEAGGVMVLERAEVTRLADELGLFLWVRP